MFKFSPVPMERTSSTENVPAETSPGDIPGRSPGRKSRGRRSRENVPEFERNMTRSKSAELSAENIKASMQRRQSFCLAENKWAIKTKLRQKDKDTQRSITMTSEDCHFLEEGDGRNEETSLNYSLHRMVSSTAFDAGMGAVIVFNAAMIGAEIQAEIYGYDTTLHTHLERIFLFIYSIELGLRFYLYRAKCLRNGWVVFDLFLVSTGLFSSVIEPFLSQGDQSNQDDFLSMILIMRIFRLAKLARTIRLLSQFRPLWMLVSGLLSSVGTMFYILILLIVILFVFACVSVELFAKNTRLREDPVFDSYVERYWADLPVSVLTLIQFVNLDGIGAIYTPMVHAEPTMILYFATFMLIVSICLMNMVTAVIVENSFEQAKTDRDFAKSERSRALQKLMPQVREIFQKLDLDGSGNVTLEEFVNADKSVQEDLEKICQTDDLVELFEMLDLDGSGSVEIDEFCDQLANFGTVDQPFINVRLMKQMEFIRRDLKENRELNVEHFARVENEFNANRECMMDTFSKLERKLNRLADEMFDMKAMIQSQGQTGATQRFQMPGLQMPGFRSRVSSYDKDEPLSPLSLDPLSNASIAPNDHDGKPLQSLLEGEITTTTPQTNDEDGKPPAAAAA